MLLTGMWQPRYRSQAELIIMFCCQLSLTHRKETRVTQPGPRTWDHLPTDIQNGAGAVPRSHGHNNMDPCSWIGIVSWPLIDQSLGVFFVNIRAFPSENLCHICLYILELISSLYPNTAFSLIGWLKSSTESPMIQNARHLTIGRLCPMWWVWIWEVTKKLNNIVLSPQKLLQNFAISY